MFYFKNGNNLTVCLNSGEHMVWKNLEDNELQKLINLCEDQDEEHLRALYNIERGLIESTITLKDGKLLLTLPDNTRVREMDVSGIEGSRLDLLIKFLSLLEENETIEEGNLEHVKKFLHNVFKNPFIDAVQELYDYLKALDFEITEDGCFLAYKNVNKDLTSVHDGVTQHKLGEYTEVTAFDTDRNQTCSEGLHFCSKSYLSCFSGDVTIVVKVNPTDVVAIPTDYSFAKGRCRRYMPVAIIQKGQSLNQVNIPELSNNLVSVVKTRKRISEKTLHDVRTAYTNILAEKGKVTREDLAEVLGFTYDTISRYIAHLKRENFDLSSLV